eukprot:11429291-Alexandrium_andersonii.AAC.1
MPGRRRAATMTPMSSARTTVCSLPAKGPGAQQPARGLSQTARPHAAWRSLWSRGWAAQPS